MVQEDQNALSIRHSIVSNKLYPLIQGLFSGSNVAACSRPDTKDFEIETVSVIIFRID